MKKTISAHVGGIVFHIEEDAYKRLQFYLENLERIWGPGPETDEILQDIEGRIAELFTQHLNGRQVVTMRDVEEVISIMGEAEEIASGEESEGNGKISFSSHKGHRKVYRDVDDKILGGVCSGIAVYFGWQPLWVRLFFLGLFFFAGTGILLYIILWILLPKAETAAERLEMRGEPVNSENIKQHFESIKSEFRKMNTSENRDKIKGFAGQLIESGGKVLGVFLMATGIVLLCILLYWLIARDFIISISGSGVFSMNDLMEIAMTDWQLFWVQTGLLLFMGGPIINLFHFSLKLLLRMKTKIKPLAIAGGIMWTMGIIIISYSAIDISRDFSSFGRDEKTIPLNTDNEHLVLKTEHDDIFHNRFSGNEEFFWELLLRKNQQVFLGWPEYQILTTDAPEPYLIVERTARGRNHKEAIKRCESIQYPLTVTENVITLSPWFSFPEQDMYRRQNILVRIYIPAGKTIILDSSMKRLGISDDEEFENPSVPVFDKPLMHTPQGLIPVIINKQKDTPIIIDSTSKTDSVSSVNLP